MKKEEMCWEEKLCRLIMKIGVDKNARTYEFFEGIKDFVKQELNKARKEERERIKEMLNREI